MKKFLTILVFLILTSLSSSFAQYVFTDSFSGPLTSWTDKYGSNWTTQSGELQGIYSLSSGGIYDHQADLILNDEYQLSGDWKASIDFIRVRDGEFSSRYDAVANFSLWKDENNKISIFVGNGGNNWGGMQDSITLHAQVWNNKWSVTDTIISISKVKFRWDPNIWHTASIEKRGSIYTIFMDDACIGHFIDKFLNAQGKIGLHTYGTKRYDNFKLEPILTRPGFTDYFSGSLSAWTDKYGSNWTTQSGELHGFYSLSSGSIYNNQADLVLNDEYQPEGNWKASVDFIRVQDDGFNYRYDANANFSLWKDKSNKISIFVGNGGNNWGGMQDSITFHVQVWDNKWSVTDTIISISKVKFRWDPNIWHTASIEKRNNIYSIFVDGAGIGHFYDSYLFGAGKIGLHTYGTKRHDNFKIETYISQITGINEESFDNNEDLIEFFPNPSSGLIRINAMDIKAISIFDINGNLIEEAYGSKEIDLTNQNKGLYFIRIITRNGMVIKKLVIK
jgi:hypothetical protein